VLVCMQCMFKTSTDIRLAKPHGMKTLNGLIAGM